MKTRVQIEARNADTDQDVTASFEAGAADDQIVELVVVDDAHERPLSYKFFKGDLIKAIHKLAN